METLEKILHRLPKAAHPAATPTWPSEPNYRCPKCKDLEFIDLGDNVFTYCECRKLRLIERRIKSSQLDPAFTHATFENYQAAPHTARMLEAAQQYANDFLQLRQERHNSLGFLAKFGESTIKAIKDPVERAVVKAQHNSYGLGKTHLLSAVAMHLLQQGVQVLLVNDADIVAEMRQQQFAEDSTQFEKLLGSIERVELQIWDDLGKAKTTEWVLGQYYRIINHRYRMGLPTCFTSNEDMDTLAEKIGDATASRLYSLCRGRLLLCEGPDYRLG